MRLRRRALAVLTAGLSLVTLAGCQKPVPEVGVVSGGTYVSQPATTWCFTFQDAAMNRCRNDTAAPREIRVKDGASVGISVPSELKDTPWAVVLSAPGTASTPERSPFQVGKTYLSLTPKLETTPQLLAEVVSYDSDGQTVRATGLWRFVLVQEPKD